MILYKSFEKYADVKFHENPSKEGGGGLFHADRQKDRHYEANSRISRFFERV